MAKRRAGGGRSAKQVAAQLKAAKASAAARSKEGRRMAEFKQRYAKAEAGEHAAWATRGGRSLVKGIKSGPSSPVSERASDKNYNKVRDEVFKKTGVTGGVGTVYGSRRFGTQGPAQVRARARAGDKDSQREWKAFQETRKKVRGKKLKD